jgi:hypothetical protein
VTALDPDDVTPRDPVDEDSIICGSLMSQIGRAS